VLEKNGLDEAATESKINSDSLNLGVCNLLLIVVDLFRSVNGLGLANPGK